MQVQLKMLHKKFIEVYFAYALSFAVIFFIIQYVAGLGLNAPNAVVYGLFFVYVVSFVLTTYFLVRTIIEKILYTFLWHFKESRVHETIKDGNRTLWVYGPLLKKYNLSITDKEVLDGRQHK